MSSLLAIARKDLLIRFSSRSEWLFFLILPLAFTAILGGGFAFGGDDDPRLPLLVVGEDNSALSAPARAGLPRGSPGPSQPEEHAPEPILSPMRRVAARGAGGWERCSSAKNSPQR